MGRKKKPYQQHYQYIAAGFSVFLDEENLLSPEERKAARALKRHLFNAAKAAHELATLREEKGNDSGINLFYHPFTEAMFDWRFQSVVYLDNAVGAIARQAPHSNPAETEKTWLSIEDELAE